MTVERSEASGAVFISYAREDADAARRIADALRAFGVEVWFDQNELRGGDAWDAKIKQQIRECALFVPVISAHTEQRTEGYFRREWKLGVERTHDMASNRAFLAPVVIDDTKETQANVPEEFLRVQWTRLAQGVPTPQFVEQIKRLLAPPTRETAAKRAQPDRLPPSGRPEQAASNGRAGWRIAAAALALAALGIGLFFALRPQPHSPAATAPGAKVSPAAAAAVPTSPATPKPEAVSPKSIAVLPFANMSDEKDANAFFADGMHEDILTQLSNIRELQVVSRTTTMQYRDTRKPMRQIGEELKVAYLLEGSVRRAGATLRITGQLINAATDAHLWAKSYDRELTTANIFAIQAELAQAIAAELRAAISPAEKSLLESRPTENLAAYDAYLEWRKERNRPILNRDKEKELLQTAVRLDPNFVAAWAELASVESRGYQFRNRSPEQLARAKATIDTAVRLAPDSPLTVRALGEYYYRCLSDKARALAQFQQLARMRPNDPEGVALIAAIQRSQGKWAEARGSFLRAVELDPANSRNVFDLVQVLAAGRRFEEARAQQRRIVARYPDDLDAAFNLAYLAYAANGATAEVEKFFAGVPASQQNSDGNLARRRHWAFRRGDAVETMQLDQPGPSADQALRVAVALVAQGNLDAARARLNDFPDKLRSYVERNPNPYSNARENLAMMEALLGHKEEALRGARKAVELLPDSTYARTHLAFIEAWTGDKAAAVAQLAQLLREPFFIGNARFNVDVVTVHVMKHDPRFYPLRGDPRFEALLNDPKNNEPLF